MTTKAMFEEQIFLVPFEQWPHLVGKIAVQQLRQSFWVEVSVVLKDSQKIFNNVGSVEVPLSVPWSTLSSYEQEELVRQAALEGRQKLFVYLQEQKEKAK